jgi:hypothetical protein
MNFRDEIETAYIQGASGRMNPSDAEICREATTYAARFPYTIWQQRGPWFITTLVGLVFGFVFGWGACAHHVF